MSGQDEIVEVHSSSGRLRRPSVSIPAQEGAGSSPLLFPRSRSSTTILLRSSSRVIPNGENVQRTADEKTKEGPDNNMMPMAVAGDGVSKDGADDGRIKDNPDGRLRKRGYQHRCHLHLGSSELAKGAVWQCTLVEFVGSLILTFVSVAAVISCLKAQFSFPRIAVAFTQFLIYTACILATAPVSGAHLNPSFSFTTMLTGHISLVRAILYIIAQSAGSVFGAYFVKLVVSEDISRMYFLGGCLLKQQVVDSDFTVSSLGADPGPGLVSEVIFTLLLISVAFPLILEYSVSTHFGDPRLVKGAIITGLLLGLLIFVSGELLAPGYTSAGMNPARCFGPAVAEGGAALWQPQWVFWLGPLLAGLIFAVLYRIVHWRNPHIYRSHSPPLAGSIIEKDEPAQAKIPLLGPDSQSARPGVALDLPPAIPPSSEPGSIVPITAPPVQPNEARRMDVFLHIKAVMHKPENDKDEGEQVPRDMQEEEIDTREHHEPANTLQSLIELPSSSASTADIILVESPVNEHAEP